jgi:tetratricopeptide (TPR) repeat protein
MKLTTSLLVAVLLSAPAAAFAQQPSTADAKKLFETGAAEYQKGNYDEAIKDWEKSYDISKKPLIFESLANAHERLGNVKQARDYLVKWREFAPKDEYELLDNRIANLDARVKHEELVEQQKKAADERAKKDAEEREKQRQAELAQQKKKSGVSIPGVIMAGAGVVAVGVGVGLDLVASGSRPSTKGVCATAPAGGFICNESIKNKLESSNSLAVDGDIVWIAGAVVASAGIVLILAHGNGTPAPDSDSGTTAMIAPVVGPRTGGFALTGSF